MAQGTTYKIVQSLKSGERSVNVMGVVTNFSSVVRTKGSDYYSRVRLADQSSPYFHLTVLLFNNNPDYLPHDSECSVGDVMCLQGIDIGSYNERPQGHLSSRSNGLWIVFRRPKQQSSTERASGGRLDWVTVRGRSCSVSAEEKEMASQLMKWWEEASRVKATESEGNEGQ